MKFTLGENMDTIIFTSPTFKEMDGTSLTIDMQLLNSNGNPAEATTKCLLALKEGRMVFRLTEPRPHEEGIYKKKPDRVTISTNSQGKATIWLDANIESFDFISASASSVVSQEYYPTGIYSNSRRAVVRVDGAIVENGVIKVHQQSIAKEGLTIQIEFDISFRKGCIVFFCVGSFYTEKITEEGSTYIQFSLPPDFSANNPLISGSHNIYYGVLYPSGNVIFPPPTEIMIIGEPATAQLLPVIIDNNGGGYINQLDDFYGVPFIIPNEQDGVSEGDSWELWYTLTEPQNDSFKKLSIKSGTVPAPETVPNGIKTTSPKNFFKGISGSPAWFVYTIISQKDKITRISTPVRCIIDTSPNNFSE